MLCWSDVKYLSIRGEMETQLARCVYDELGEAEKKTRTATLSRRRRQPRDGASAVRPANQRRAVRDGEGDCWPNADVRWREAIDQVINPTEDSCPNDNRTPEEIGESIAKGRELFFGTKANCFTCHGPTGSATASQTDYDIWSKEQGASIATQRFRSAESIVSQQKEIARLGREGKEDDEEEAKLSRTKPSLALASRLPHEFYPIRNAIPRNLRKGVYRGGRRRLDLYCRISAGIAGTPMPGVSAAGARGAGDAHRRRRFGTSSITC